MTDVKNTQQICREFIKTIAQENNYGSDYVVTPISTEGANYTSHLFVTTLTKGDESLELFAKVAAVGEKLRAQNPLRMYDTEIFFYTKIAKLYHDLEEHNSVPTEHRLRLPKFHGCNPKVYEETIVLENLVARGFTTHDRMQTVTWEYAAAATTELAKYHALSMAYQEKYPEEFVKDAELLKVEFQMTEQYQAFYDKTIDNALDVVKEENRERLKKFLKEHLVGDGFMKFFKPLKRPVMTHGDFRPSNLMHKFKEGSIEVIPVDFQTAQIGCIITDLLYFIFSATDEEFRRDHYHQLVDHYYVQLGKSLKRLGLEPDKIYPRADFDFEMAEKKPFGLSIAVVILPIVTVEAKKAPKVDKDMELETFTVAINKNLLPQRLNGVVDDYIRWGDLV